MFQHVWFLRLLFQPLNKKANMSLYIGWSRSNSPALAQLLNESHVWFYIHHFVSRLDCHITSTISLGRPWASKSGLSIFRLQGVTRLSEISIPVVEGLVCMAIFMELWLTSVEWQIWCLCPPFITCSEFCHSKRSEEICRWRTPATGVTAHPCPLLWDPGSLLHISSPGDYLHLPGSLLMVSWIPCDLVED